MRYVPGADDRVEVLERALARARLRLRLRSLVRAGAMGVQVGLVLAVPAAIVARLLDAGAVPAVLAATAVTSGAVAISLLVGALIRTPDRRAVALLVDRLGATEELLLTALHVIGSADPNRDAILARLDPERLPDLRRALPVRVPRHLRYAVAPLALVIAAALVVPPAFVWSDEAAPDPVAAEGERIAERLADVADPVGDALPEALREDLVRLADDLQGSDLTPEEARQRLEDAQEQLEALQEELARSADLLEELERAARALDEEATRELGEALREGDLGAAAEAARDLSRDLAEASPEERRRAAEALTHAGDALQRSSDPAAKGVGQALERAGQAASGQAAEHGGLPAEQARQLSDELEQARDLAEQAKRDQQALRRSQEINGALESSRQRLGGAPQVAQGEGEGRGEGEGQGAGQGQHAGGAPGRGAGAVGHTWEDEGEFDGGAGTEGEREDRQSDRQGGQHIDDFQKLYEAVRLDGARSLVTSVEGELDESGHVDQLPIRLTEAEEAAKTGTLELPAAYAEAAAEAIEAEPIPPAYKQAVKRYFDAME